jgi:dihydroorotate dehydrogenase electron transfer subunit
MQALQQLPRIYDSRVIDRDEPVPGIVIFGVAAEEIAAAALPGQFAMIVPPGGEQAAVALGIYEASGGRISFMVVVAGRRTAELAALRPGNPISLLAPLGNGFDLESLGEDVAIVAGGVGIASLLLPAQALIRAGKRAHLYYGARTAAALIGVAGFADLGVGATLATDDGSLGRRGYVTDALLESGRSHSAIAACGPSPMLRAAGRAAQVLGVRAQLSLEETFACGVGACWGCVVPLDRASAQAPRFPQAAAPETRDFVHARICKEGPVFWAHELRW